MGVSRLDRVRIKEVLKIAGIEMKLSSRVDHSIEMVRTRGENGRVPYG